MAVDYFLDLDGIPGESQDEKFKDKIQVLSWSWGASNVSSVAGTGGSGAGKATGAAAARKGAAAVQSSATMVSDFTLILPGVVQGRVTRRHEAAKLTAPAFFSAGAVVHDPN